MNNRVLIMALHDTIVKDRGSGRAIDATIARIMGWTGVQFFERDGSYMGLPPRAEHHAQVPAFSTTLDGALLLRPEHWVESYHRRHDDSVVVELHPRGDLKMENITTYGDDLIVTFIDAFLTARLQMIVGQDL